MSTQIKNNKNNKDWSKLLKYDMIVVEIGSGCGDNIDQINKNLKRGSIYAIEVDIKKFEILQGNCLNWERASNNKIYCLQIGISDNNQENITNFLGNTTDLYTLDTLFRAIQPHLIKINNIEGQLKILQGSQSLLKQGKCKFLITLNPGDNHEDIFNLMKSFGYKTQNFYQMNLFINPSHHHWYRHLFNSLKKRVRNIIPASLRYREFKKLW